MSAQPSSHERSPMPATLEPLVIKKNTKRKASNDASDASDARQKEPKWVWTDAEVNAMLLVLHETYEATGTQSFQDTTWIKANEAVSRLTPAKAGNFKKVSQKWKSCLVDTKAINQCLSISGAGWDEATCCPILNEAQWKAAKAKCPGAAIIERRTSNLYYPLTAAILGKDYATGSDGFSYGDEPSTTQSTPAPHPGRRCPHPSKGSDGELVELSGDETTASAGELDDDSDPRGAGKIPLSALGPNKRAIIQAKKEHMDNALAAMEQRNEYCNICMMGNLISMMMTDREKFLKHFYKFEELDQAAWDTVVSYVGACGDTLPLSVITYLANLNTRWEPTWAIASEIIAEARNANDQKLTANAFYVVHQAHFPLPPLQYDGTQA